MGAAAGSSRTHGAGALQGLLRRIRRARERDAAVMQHYSAAGTLLSHQPGIDGKLSVTSSDVRLRPQLRLRLLSLQGGAAHSMDASAGFEMPGAVNQVPAESYPVGSMHPALLQLVTQGKVVQLSQHLVLSVVCIEQAVGVETGGGQLPLPCDVGSHALLVSRADVMTAGAVGYSALRAAAGECLALFAPWTAVQLPWQHAGSACSIPTICSFGLLAMVPT